MKINIRQWNIYLAWVPYTENFRKRETRPVIVIRKHGGDVIILPITSHIEKKYQFDLEINLNLPSLIKVGNIQSINQKDIIAPYQNLVTKKIIYLNKNKKLEIINNLNKLFTE
ncbi:hypothetical protein LT335_00112 [Spiroplasma sp. JKS002669]|uniref:type II toxin-antitoxin system PemK/MazF family toxin n=1 Tax=Spiroplasma attinicola TaxID=2904537 RepID=UPI002022ED69|nr:MULTISPECIES: type II toxin-antitoxin system PemK/MazF family toxin [unclassified Spiroplasma]MCL6428573.1 hypothetical protein [Spiroplasma sp. JKS002669]MCL8209914.1 hypothetical protein [Spiroplasma sp. JKS002670]